MNVFSDLVKLISHGAKTLFVFATVITTAHFANNVTDNWLLSAGIGCFAGSIILLIWNFAQDLIYASKFKRIADQAIKKSRSLLDDVQSDMSFENQNFLIKEARHILINAKDLIYIHRYSPKISEPEVNRLQRALRITPISAQDDSGTWMS